MDNPYKAPASELTLNDLSDPADAVAADGNFDPLADWTPATSGQRFGAYFIDGFLVTAVVFGLTFALIVLAELAGSPDIVDVVPDQVFGLIVMVPVAVIFGLMESSGMQGSLGKKLLGLRVITVDGRDLDQPTAMKRNFIKFMGLGLCGLLGFTVLGGEGKSLWDNQASTRVVKRNPFADV